jgi:hypothetical protein
LNWRWPHGTPVRANSSLLNGCHDLLMPTTRRRPHMHRPVITGGAPGSMTRTGIVAKFQREWV